jgi:hypothetical protein
LSSQSDSKKLSRFQSCCPLRRKTFPEGVCEHGLVRARWMADNIGYLAFEEKQARGCPFGMLTEDKHSYCFFKLMSEIEEPMTDEEISKLLCLSKDQIKRVVDSAFYKLKANESIHTLQELFEDGDLFEEQPLEDDIYFPDEFSAESVQSDGVIEESIPSSIKDRD